MFVAGCVLRLPKQTVYALYQCVDRGIGGTLLSPVAVYIQAGGEPAPMDSRLALIELLNALLPLYLANQLLRSLQEAAASELASRMTAMNNASDNAKALAKSLTLDYNKARQAAITQEILEVVGGSSAM